jgi:hypothetical protein
MSSTKVPLSMIKVASPCTASWDAMKGDDTTRFCGQCSQYVYNLSEMTEDEADALIMEHEGKMCVRFYQRPDGTMMTKDCPVGWRAVKRRFAVVAGVAAATLISVFGIMTAGVLGASVRGNGNGGLRFVNPIAQVHDWLFPAAVQGGMMPPVVAPPRQNPPMVMGEMCPD